jgi:histidinol dehydrogenase
LKDQIADKDEVITSNDHVIAEQQAEIERLRADLAHADAKGQENDKLLWGTIKDNERLRKMLWEVNEQCPEHVPVSLLNQIRAALKGK